MATVTEIKNKLIKRMAEIDISNASIDELKEYTNVLKSLTEISEKSYGDVLSECLHKMYDVNHTETTIPFYELGIGAC